MASQQLEPKKVFGFRIPKGADNSVLEYLNDYIQSHERGIGKHVWHLVRRGLEADGHLPASAPSLQATISQQS